MPDGPKNPAEELQKAVAELADFPQRPEAAWVSKVSAAPTEVIVGAILHWAGQTGVIGGPDPQASRREAAQAILQARLSAQMQDATTRLRETIDAYQRVSGTQTAWLLRLTWLIAVLAAAALVAAFIQSWIELSGATEKARATHYQIVHLRDSQVARLDTRTGKIDICVNAGGTIVCD